MRGDQKLGHRLPRGPEAASRTPGPFIATDPLHLPTVFGSESQRSVSKITSFPT